MVRSAAWGVSAPFAETYEDIDTQRARDLLGLFSVDHLEERPFHTLSQGEKQRVLVARALMIDPEMLVLDEPAAALDLGGRELLLGGLAELAKDPKSPVMVMVTHHLEEIPPGFTHVLVMRHGQVAHCGPLSRVLNSENLSEVYEIPLRVETEAGRFTARLELH